MKYQFQSIFTMLAALLAAAAAHAACVPPNCTAFPADAGFISVRDFGAKGDGVADDTAAINAALAASGGDTGPAFWHDRMVYLPDGAYLVTAPLVKRYANGHFANGSMLIGQSRAHTVIQLKDHAPGYNDAKNPKAVIFTTAKLLDGNTTGGGKDYLNKGEGNDAYMNFVENLTVDVGAANPGAIGIDYLANNLGAVRNVLVRAPDGSGATGIAMTRKWPGPALLQNVTVQGFDTGIDVAGSEYGVTIDDIHLEKQRQIALRNNHNMLAAHNLTIRGAPLPLANMAQDGLMVIDSASIAKEKSGDEAIHNEGYLNLHTLKISGYKTILGALPAASISGVYNRNARLYASAVSWSLPVKNAPLPTADPIERWTGVAAVPDSGGDATDAIRKAFASGASTVYFRHGTYLISDNIVIPPTVRRIVGMTSTIHAYPDRTLNFHRDWGMFRAANNRAPLVIEKLAFDNSGLGDQVAVEASGSQPVVLRDVVGAGVTTLLRPVAGGEVFIEDSCCGKILLAGDQSVWARQLNSEGPGVRVENQGAPLWILGLKTEQDCTAIENTNKARTELLGGLLYITGTHADPAIPAFSNRDSKMMLSYVEESFSSNATYATHLIDKQNGKTQTVTASELPPRNLGRIVPQLISRQ